MLFLDLCSNHTTNPLPSFRMQLIKLKEESKRIAVELLMACGKTRTDPHEFCRMCVGAAQGDRSTILLEMMSHISHCSLRLQV